MRTSPSLYARRSRAREGSGGGREVGAQGPSVWIQARAFGDGVLRGLQPRHVVLVDIKETPIERITPRGIKTSDREYEFDVIIYATGFER